MADAGDLKSPVATRAGSNPAPGTIWANWLLDFAVQVRGGLPDSNPLRVYSAPLCGACVLRLEWCSFVDCVHFAMHPSNRTRIPPPALSRLL